LKDQGIEVRIVLFNQVLVAEAEFDEMWFFVSDKSHQCWLWWAIDHNIGVSLAYCFGIREHKYFDELCCLFALFRVSIVYCGGNVVYKMHIIESIVTPGKRNTWCILCRHLSLCTWCSRFVRCGIRFSKSFLMHKIVVGLVINFWFFKRELPFHLI
jgi:IS1 family transposase